MKLSLSRILPLSILYKLLNYTFKLSFQTFSDIINIEDITKIYHILKCLGVNHHFS